MHLYNTNFSFVLLEISSSNSSPPVFYIQVYTRQRGRLVYELHYIYIYMYVYIYIYIFIFVLIDIYLRIYLCSVVVYVYMRVLVCSMRLLVSPLVS